MRKTWRNARLGSPTVTPRETLLAALSPELVMALEQLVADRVSVELETVAQSANGRKWLTLDEAGERLGVSAAAIRMRVRRGRLDARRQGRRVYVSAESLDLLA